MSRTAWGLVFQQAGEPPIATEHDTRDEALEQLSSYLVDLGITAQSDPSAFARSLSGDFGADFVTDDNIPVQYKLRQIQVAIAYLNLKQVEERLGLAGGSLSKVRLPVPDAIVGPVNDDGSLPRGTTKGWLVETIDRWNANRPGRGARTDLDQRKAAAP